MSCVKKKPKIGNDNIFSHLSIAHWGNGANVTVWFIPTKSACQQRWYDEASSPPQRTTSLLVTPQQDRSEPKASLPGVREPTSSPDGSAIHRCITGMALNIGFICWTCRLAWHRDLRGAPRGPFATGAESTWISDPTSGRMSGGRESQLPFPVPFPSEAQNAQSGFQRGPAPCGMAGGEVCLLD